MAQAQVYIAIPSIIIMYLSSYPRLLVGDSLPGPAILFKYNPRPVVFQH